MEPMSAATAATAAAATSATTGAVAAAATTAAETVSPVRSSLLRQGIVRALLAYNVHRPVHRHHVLTIPSFFASWLVGEAAPSVLAFWGVRSLAGVVRARRNGGLSRSDKLGLALTAGSAAALAASIPSAVRSREELHAAVSTVVGEDELAERPRAPRGAAWNLLANGARRRVKTRGVVYADVGTHRLKMDVYEPLHPAEAGELRPAIIQIHGGAWVVGSKDEQGVPLLNHLAANGWVGFNIEYRLSPSAKFPTHLQDCKRALAFIREHAADWSIDPDFIAVTGGSAGGHLTALMALTANEPFFQPGFEDADTTVQAAVPFYGVYDTIDRHEEHLTGFVDFLGRIVMGSTHVEDPESWARYSPLDHISGDIPPMMIVHGDRDVLVPVGGARRFAAAVREASANPVVYAELHGAQHAFEIFPGPRTANTIEFVERFLHHVHAQYLAGSAGTGASDAEGAGGEPSAAYAATSD